jgi:hypothetical protein
MHPSTEAAVRPDGAGTGASGQGSHEATADLASMGMVLMTRNQDLEADLVLMRAEAASVSAS